MEEDDKVCPMIRMGVSGWVFLLVPAYPGCPGPMTVKRLCVCLLVRIICIYLKMFLLLVYSRELFKTYKWNWLWFFLFLKCKTSVIAVGYSWNIVCNYVLLYLVMIIAVLFLVGFVSFIFQVLLFVCICFICAVCSYALLVLVLCGQLWSETNKQISLCWSAYFGS